ncbi:MAG: hypothetical protein HETSPECPRED_007050 [Heterodermia speciosa]|uniref:Uncharacterized protein n=1 Tax=Heterodermia speciosa TaxID=116794 RepID=A0A8H3EKN6_9LECA|nr:MAG: hypothetical protein HETSPECPRED_007050 [Heterodermia speciosa]
MSTSKLSQSPNLRIAASIIGTIFLGFGIKFSLQPRSALGFFEFHVPALASDRRLAESLIVLYAVRDIFMGLAIYAATYFGDRRALGWILIAGGGVAFVDGAVCRGQVGKGEWSHWGYAPMLEIVGAMLLGVLDKA